jgi:hypothetical protein
MLQSNTGNEYKSNEFKFCFQHNDIKRTKQTIMINDVIFYEMLNK